MSYYEDERQRMRPTRERSGRDYYDDDSAFDSRRYNKTTTLVKRRDSYDDVDEEVTRDFSPPSGRGGYIRETTIRRSGVRPSRARSYDDDDRHSDDRYDNGAYAGARRGDRQRNDRRDRDRYQRPASDYDSRSRSRTPPTRERRKSKVDEALASLGLGGLVGGLLGKDAKDKASSEDRYRSKSRNGRAYSESRSDRKGGGAVTREKVTQAITAAVLAGAGEAFRSRKEAGGFSGDKGKRILTAAFAAGGVDALLKSGKSADDHSIRDTIGSTIAGLATSRVVNGSRSQSRGRNGSPDSRRGRNSSRGGGGVGDLLAGGAVAAAAKKVYDNVRSKSRGRSESPSRSRYSDVSRSPSRSKSRRRSVSRAAARGLAAVGLTGAAGKLDPDRDRDSRKARRRYSDDYDDRSSYYDDYRDDVGKPRSGNAKSRARGVSQSSSSSSSDGEGGKPRAITPGGYALDFGPRHNGDPDTDSDSDLGCSSDEEKERKQRRKKWLLTTGLASIATIHAGHELYESYEKHEHRKNEVRLGEITAEEAKKKQNRARLQEVAGVGIAALGIKGAYSEWKEMKEHREEYLKDTEKFERHRHKRAARRKKFKRLEKQGYLDGGFSSSMPNLHDPGMNAPPGGWHQPFANQPPYATGYQPHPAGNPDYTAPVYYDDNPYGGSFAQPTAQAGGSQFPPPPLGNDHRPQAQVPQQR